MAGGQGTIGAVPHSVDNSEPPRDRMLRTALRVAGTIRAGSLTVVMPDGRHHAVTASAAPAATIMLKDPRAVARLMTGGSLGFAQAYVDGLWDSPDIGAVMALAAANEIEWRSMLKGGRRTRLMSRLRRRPRHDITEHYDLGSAFYAAWLDPTMSYSSAVFEGPDDTLEAAQLRKIHRMCQKLQLAPGMRLLEIGCGWGAFAEVAARDYGVSVLGVTLSPAQLASAQAHVERAGLASRVELRLQDYRDVEGRFDRIASIEMFEALGERHWGAFFGAVRARLHNHGVAGLQVITIEDRLFDSYRATPDFVRRHIVPGGTLPSRRRLAKAIGRAGLALGHEEWFGPDYARTLAIWQDAFQAAWPRIVAATALNRHPADDRFKRIWEYYLAYCRIGFAAGWTDVGHILIARNG